MYFQLSSPLFYCFLRTFVSFLSIRFKFSDICFPWNISCGILTFLRLSFYLLWSSIVLSFYSFQLQNFEFYLMCAWVCVCYVFVWVFSFLRFRLLNWFFDSSASYFSVQEILVQSVIFFLKCIFRSVCICASSSSCFVTFLDFLSSLCLFQGDFLSSMSLCQFAPTNVHST